MDEVSQVYRDSPSGTLISKNQVQSSKENIFICCPPAATTVLLELGQNWQLFNPVLAYFVTKRLPLGSSPIGMCGEVILCDNPRVETAQSPYWIQSGYSHLSMKLNLLSLSVPQLCKLPLLLSNPRCEPKLRQRYVLIPSATCQKRLVFRFETKRENSVAVTLLLPENALEVMGGLFCFLVIYPYGIVKSRSGKVATIASIVQSKNLIIGLNSMPDLFSGFGEELEEVPVGICGQDDGSQRLKFFRIGSPPDSIDGGITVRFLIFDVSVDFSYFSIFKQVVNANISIAGPIGNQRILRGEFSYHDLAFLFY